MPPFTLPFRTILPAGHTDDINALVALPDGRLASGSEDGTVKLWNAESGECLATLEGHSGIVLALALLPDGRLASASDDRTVKLWNTESGECLATLKGHSGPVQTLALLPDGRLASGSGDHTVKLWNTESGEVETIQAHGEVWAMALDGKKTDLLFSHGTGIGALPLKLPERAENPSGARTHTQTYMATVKTLLLGNGGAGKSTLAFRLATGSYCPHLKSTHGMQLWEHTRPNLSVKGVKPPVHARFLLWDFAGQPEYQLAHQQSYENTALVLLVVDLSLPEAEEMAEHAFWIDRIKEAFPGDKKPTVFLLGSHCKTAARLLLKRLRRIGAPLGKAGFRRRHLLLGWEEEETCFRHLTRSMEKYLARRWPGSPAPVSLPKEKENVFRTLSRHREQEGFFTDPFKEGLEETMVEQMIQSGEIERLDQATLLLRPHWRNLLSTALYRMAENNAMVHGAVEIDALAAHDFQVEFDATLADKCRPHMETAQSRNDEDPLPRYDTLTVLESDGRRYHDSRKSHPQCHNLLVKKTLQTILEKSHAYRKLGVLVFPSRFCAQDGVYEDRNRFSRLTDFPLAGKENVEEMVAAVVVELHLAGTFKIVKHLYDRVEYRKEESPGTFRIRFIRPDKTKIKSMEPVVRLDLYSDAGDEEANLLFQAQVEKIVNRRNLPVHPARSYTLSKEGHTLELTIGSRETGGEALFDRAVDKIEKTFASWRLGLSQPKADAVAALGRTIEEKREEETAAVLAILEKRWEENTEKENTPPFSILQLSDLHIGPDFDEAQEVRLLMEDLGRINACKQTGGPIDALALCGDLTHTGSREECLKTAEFIQTLADALKIPATRIWAVPGNHDYHRPDAQAAYSVEKAALMEKRTKERKAEHLPPIDYPVHGDYCLYRDEEKWNRRFAYFSRYLYEFLYNQPFHPNPEK